MRRTRGLLGWFRRQPVRFRLALVSGALTAVILIGFAMVVGRLVTNRLEADFRNEVRGSAIALALDLRVAVEDGQFTVNRDLAEIAMATDAEIRIADTLGNPLFESPGAPDLGPPRTQGTIRDAAESLKVVDQRILSSNSFTGPLFVQYARDTASVDATTERLWLFLGAGVAIGTMLAGFAGMTVAARAMQPIANLTRTARAIARTRDPSMRIHPPMSEDEVAELARTLDEMLRELDAARSEAEGTVQRQREFVADASHELRTPLTSILANLEMLEEELPPDASEDQRAAARSALRSSRRMSRLVGDLLILARADAGRRSRPVSCDLAVIASEAFEEVRPVADEHRLEAEIDESAELEGDPDELHRMISNLLENAISHTPPGTTVRLSLHSGSSRAVLEVVDNGPGLPKGMEDQVFERFVSGRGPADRGVRSEGTGLGLAIVRAVAVAHGGEVVAGRSRLGGARFTISIPLGDREPTISDELESTLRKR